MRAVFSTQEPAKFFSGHLLGVYVKLVIALDEAMASVPDIAGFDRVRISVFRSFGCSSHLYVRSFGMPFELKCRLLDDETDKVVAQIGALLYTNETTKEARGGRNIPPSDHVGDIDTVIKSLAADMPKRLLRECEKYGFTASMP